MELHTGSDYFRDEIEKERIQNEEDGNVNFQSNNKLNHDMEIDNILKDLEWENEFKTATLKLEDVFD